ncbi:DddA-like double-stranded DNA deaminase toxin [Actinosynnema sp.]|uniref:DddA-like double-stranded DNA deaminase toxin n=1 Tax=Actinosynnema sp. TaxID=1872144 RepID=UPI003F85FE7B
MPSLGDVGAALGRVAEVAAGAQACLAQAADLAAEAAELVEAAGAGSGQTDVVTAAAAFREVAHDADRVVGRDLDAALGAVRRIIAALGTSGGERASPCANRSERVDELAERLPPPVVPNTSAKTHGWWFTGRGAAQELISGEGPDAQAAYEALRQEGYPRPGMPFVAMHVEIKLAAHMRRNNIEHATVVINNIPCPLVWGCENLIGVVLPAGSSLTVHGSNGYERTFTGGRKPPWPR